MRRTNVARGTRRRDSADHRPAVAVVALGQQQLGKEPLVGELLAFGDPYGLIRCDARGVPRTPPFWVYEVYSITVPGTARPGVACAVA